MNEEKIKNSCSCEDCNCTEDKKQESCECENCGCDNHDKKENKKKKNKNEDKLNEAYNKISQLEDELIRSKADLINYRKRKDEEVIRMLKYSDEDIVKEILPIIDNFERAINMDDDNLDDEISKFLAGFKMIYCNLVSVLEKYEVKAIDGFNKPFDPTYHQAVMTEKRENVAPGIVVEVLQKGYLLKDKVIRPAMVRVSE